MFKIKRSNRTLATDSLTLAEHSLKALKGRKEIGFHQVTERPEIWQSSQRRAQEIKKYAQTVAIVGLGGSSLGARALWSALGKTQSQVEFEFFDNVDPYGFQRKLSRLNDLNKVHWVLISKSGSTIETVHLTNQISQLLAEKNIELSQHATVITENKANPLNDWATKNNVPVLDLPEDIGGRFSVLTPVGLLPAAIMGLDLEAIKGGVNKALSKDYLVTQLSAEVYESFLRQEWITVFWFYSHQLEIFGSWLQQLWAESLAKLKDRNGRRGSRVSTPLPCVGVRDQHSVLQQFVEGYKDKHIWFFEINDLKGWDESLKSSLFGNQDPLVGKPMSHLFKAEAEGTQEALMDIDVSCLTLELDQVSEKAMGELFMILQLVVGTLGEMLDIDAFNQPGVEAGKVITRDLLKNNQ